MGREVSSAGGSGWSWRIGPGLAELAGAAGVLRQRSWPGCSPAELAAGRDRAECRNYGYSALHIHQQQVFELELLVVILVLLLLPRYSPCSITII